MYNTAPKTHDYWIGLHFPNLALAALTDPFNSAPKVVVEKRRHTEVVVCNDAATKQGVTRHMRLTHAQSLCHHLQVLRRDPAKEAQALEDLARWFYNISPEVAVYPNNTLLMNVSGVLGLWGGWPTLARKLSTLPGAAHPTIAIAQQPQAAAVLAENSKHSHTENWYQSNTCWKHQLESLPLTALQLPTKLQQHFAQLGIDSVGALRQLPATEVAERYGKGVRHQLELLFGLRNEPPSYYSPQLNFEKSVAFDEPVLQLNQLLFPLRRLVDELMQFMRQRCHHANHIQLQLQADKGCQHLDLHRGQTPWDSPLLFNLLQLKLDTLHDLAVEKISLTLVDSQPVHTATLSLFDDHKNEQNSTQLISRLKARLGEGQVRRLYPTDEPLPEKSWSLSAEAEGKPSINSLKRPCWLLKQPFSLQQQDGIPYWHGILQIFSPVERLDTDWWHGQQQHRDYFMAQTPQGAWLWIYRQRDNDSWFCHGFFG